MTGRTLKQFRNYCGLVKFARCGFPWRKTTKRPASSVYTHCETALALTALLWMLTACRQEQLSLPVTHAAVSQPDGPAVVAPEPTPSPFNLEPGSSCYSFILLRPKSQRAIAVQARLKQVDAMAAALDSRTVTVDLVGDHANILSLRFPVRWPAPPSWSDRVSAVLDNYFSSPEIEDDMCNSGFAEVRLSARGVNDGRIHPIWTARVTSEGLLKTDAENQQLANSNPAP
jgi:hypothetical protein